MKNKKVKCPECGKEGSLRMMRTVVEKCNDIVMTEDGPAYIYTVGKGIGVDIVSKVIVCNKCKVSYTEEEFLKVLRKDGKWIQ
jgi:ribosomal protein L37AE/L43A